ncbi:hypothetical protein KC711_07475 [Candidatus Peregrinibacteria bacterium]|nr:hypothetical protein [Candidatus Peregrinibacteria bacterium]MCB9804596.1 hypothetical protein [Candidatus Peribacteria bacterium]
MITKCVLTIITLLSATSTVYAVPICNGHGNVKTYDGKPAAVVTTVKRVGNGYKFEYQYPNLDRVYHDQVNTSPYAITKGDSVAFVQYLDDPKSVMKNIIICGKNAVLASPEAIQIP